MTHHNPFAHALMNNTLFLEEGSLDRGNVLLAEAARILDGRSPQAIDKTDDDQDDFFDSTDAFSQEYRPYVVKDGVLTIPVKGVLLAKLSYAIGDLATGYDYIERAFTKGMKDPKVKAVALDVDSPGGEVNGLFLLADAMNSLKTSSGKPVAALCEYACSAAYALASTADAGQLYIGDTSIVGSIGVLTYHEDVSGALEKAGVKITYIYAGKHKVEGNSTQPLSSAAKERMQARIDHLYGMFVALVARNRNMDAKAVQATEALTFYSTGAISAGLADVETSLPLARANFHKAVKHGAKAMAGYTEEDMTARVNAARIEGHAAGAREKEAELSSAIQAAKDASVKAAAAVATERARIKAIIELPEAKTRMATAITLALASSDMLPTSAAAVLASVPEAATPLAKTFEQRMDESQNPNVGADAGRVKTSKAWELMKDFNTAHGTSYGPKHS